MIVTYEPDLQRLGKLLVALEGQVDIVVVVDNGSSNNPATLLRHRPEVAYLPMAENLGIATAQNAAIAEARRRRCDYVVLFDQDSLPPSGMIDTLTDIAEQKRLLGELVAAVGPSFLDERLQKPSRFLRMSGWKSRLQTRDDGPVVPVDHLIASGCLIPLMALDRVGEMRDELFIDYVDTEWSLRAEHRFGLLSYGTFAVTLSHELGERPIIAFGRRYAIHSPLRHYYLFRNSVWLWRQGWIPLRWKVAGAPRLVLRLAFVAIFARPVQAHWRMILRGLRDGFVGKMGKYEDR